MATISFLNIYLPDSTFDEPRSHGYFAFSIRQKAGLLPGTEIPASAGIIFDFNAPVQTNLVMNTLYDPLGFTVREMNHDSHGCLSRIQRQESCCQCG
jgi:hypothetical protein